jgi:3-methylcrotonyl-CoA carboxylase alpha subunit
MNEPHLHKFTLCYREREVEVTAEQSGDRGQAFYLLEYEGQSARVSGVLKVDQLHADVDGFKQKLSVAEHDGVFSAYRRDGVFHFQQQRADTGDMEATGPSGNPRAPMNGIIVALLVEPGEVVAAETPLLVMEAMKMEHTIRAPAAGSVSEFYFQPKELVEGDAELLNFEVEE